MKISYKVLQRYIKDIKTPEKVAQDLIMHTAEVEEIVYKWENLKDVYIWEILDVKKHPDSEKLNICRVRVLWKEHQIVCGASNVKANIKVPVAVLWAKLAPDFEIKKTQIRWVESEWMICSEDELWLVEERQKGIMILPDDAQIDTCMREYLNEDDIILEVDNKAINHRPDMFSHIWVIRELYAINWEKFDYEYSKRDFSSLPDLWIENEIPWVASRYIWLEVKWVKNIESPDYIKEVLGSAWIAPRWLLVDISNYCLYMYGQPIHCFDADKIKWKITVRFAKDGEDFVWLNNKKYKLCSEDIVITDEEKVISLAWVLWDKYSSVSDNTKNIIIESGHYDQAFLRKTWKRIWVRTDALNVNEKDIVNWMQLAWTSLVVDELEKIFEWIQLTRHTDSYPVKQKEVTIPFDLDFINNLIWSSYSREESLEILENLWIKEKKNELQIPFWRKDLNYKADIAEEISRIKWYDEVKATVPRINLWAIRQTDIYKLKNEAINFFTTKGFFDMYNYSFVNEELMKKMEWDVENLVPMKNALTEEMTHMKGSLIPNLMLSLEWNIRDFDDLKLFELEKTFKLKKGSEIEEKYYISGVMTSKEDVVYYDMSQVVSDFLKSVGVDNFYFDTKKSYPEFCHKWRTAKIVVRWKEVWIVWEVHPKVTKNFSLRCRVWFFEIDADLLKNSIYGKIKAKEISTFQENKFDLSFVVDKLKKWKDIQSTIEKTDLKLIRKVELFDIFESEEKLPWKRSLSFKVYIQSMKETLDDKVKNNLIEEIIKRVAKVWGELR